MADAIVQTIKIEVDGAEEASAEIRKVGQATEEVQATAAKTAGGTAALGAGLDNVTRKSGLTRTEMRALGAVMRQLGAGEVAGLAMQLNRMSMAFGTVGVAVLGAAIAFGYLVKKFTEAVGEIVKIDAAAMSIGMTIEQFDQLRLSMEKAGISAKAIMSILEKLGEASDKAALERVNKAFKEMSDGVPRGFGAWVAQFNVLQEAAKGTGKAADAARAALLSLGLAAGPLTDRLGQPIDSGLPKTLSELIAKTGSASAGLAAFVEQLRQMPDSTNRSTLAIQELGKEGGTELIQALRTGGVAIDQFAQKQGTLSQATANSAAQAEQSVNKATAATERFAQTEVAPTVLSGWNALIAKANEYLEVLAQIFGRTTAAATPSGGGAAGGQVGGSAGFAGGGLLGGRGSGTSDSNLAWVSRGEYITPARAVRQPGVLALLEALRRSGGNLRGVLDGMGRFELGGMVRAPLAIPAFAGGGMNAVTIQFPGLPDITGLRASSGVVDELRKAAALAQVRSGGRKPSRYS